MQTTEGVQEKVADLENMDPGLCRTLLEYVITMRTSCFGSDFASQMKLTKFPLIQCFDCKYLAVVESQT